jgi:hypothetical protein
MTEVNWSIRFGFVFPTYGNYGGPRYTGGQVDGTNTTVAPKNGLDAVYQRHDIRYALAENAPNEVILRYEADIALRNETISFLNSSEGLALSGQDRFYANVAMVLFVGKDLPIVAPYHSTNFILDFLKEYGPPGLGNYVSRCFLAGTPILLPDGSSVPIESIRPGDRVASFMGGFDFNGAAALKAPIVPGHVVRLLGSITTSVIAIHYEIDGAPYTIYATPLHVMLTGSGRWMQARDALMAGERFVAINGQLVAASYEMIQYGSARGEELTRTFAAFAAVTGQVFQDENGLAIAPREVTGWQTYNFEVKATHTYVAGGLKVHNWSIGDELVRLANEQPETFGYNQSLDKYALREAVTFRDADGVARSAYTVDNFGNTHFLTGVADASGNTIVVGDRVVMRVGDSGREAEYQIDMTRTVNAATGAVTDTEFTALTKDGVGLTEAAIGGSLGSALGNALAAKVGGGTFAGQQLTSTILGTIGQNIGEALGFAYGAYNESLISNVSGLSALSYGVDRAFGNIGVDLIKNGISGLSGVLYAELAAKMGLSGFAAGAFTTLGTTITQQLTSNVLDLAIGKAGVTLMTGFDVATFGLQLQTAGSAYLGSYLATQLVQPENTDAAIAASIGGAIGSLVGQFLLPGPIGALIGNFVGKLAGTLFGNANGADVKSYGFVVADFTHESYIAGGFAGRNGGNLHTFEGIGQSQRWCQ